MKKLLILLLVFASCTESNKEENKKEENNTGTEKVNGDEYLPLKSVLDQKKDAFNKNAPQKKKDIYADGINAIIERGILDRALNIGDTAPDFELTNAEGKLVTLGSYLNKGPVILTWYRGGWCPYCNLTLARYQEELPKFKSAGANLIALSPELPDSTMTTAEKHDLQFEILSDFGNSVAKKYDVIFELTPEVAEIYQNGFDLHTYNGDESNTLPLAATYVIDRNGIIQYAFLDADYRNRAEPRDIIEALKKL